MKQPNIDAIRMCWMNESSSHRINRNMNLCAHFYRCCARFAHMMFIQMFAEGWPTRHNNRQFYSSMWPYLFHFICFYFYRRSAFVPSFFDVDVCVSHCCLPWHVRLFECLNSRSRLNVRVWAFDKMSISCIPSLTSYYCTLSLAQHFVWYSVSSRLASAQNTNLGTYHKMSPFFCAWTKLLCWEPIFMASIQWICLGTKPPWHRKKIGGSQSMSLRVSWGSSAPHFQLGRSSTVSRTDKHCLFLYPSMGCEREFE